MTRKSGSVDLVRASNVVYADNADEFPSFIGQELEETELRLDYTHAGMSVREDVCELLTVQSSVHAHTDDLIAISEEATAEKFLLKLFHFFVCHPLIIEMDCLSLSFHFLNFSNQELDFIFLLLLMRLD